MKIKWYYAYKVFSKMFEILKESIYIGYIIVDIVPPTLPDSIEAKKFPHRAYTLHQP